MINILFYIDTIVGGGAEKVLLNLVNHMDQNKFNITVQTLFPDAGKDYLATGIRYKYTYSKQTQFYKKLYRVEAALGTIYNLRLKDDYDIEVAYLECGPTKVIANSTNKKAKKIAWVHCDFSVAFGEEFKTKCRSWYHKYDQVVCVSEKAKDSFIDYFGTDTPVCVIHNVVDSDFIIDQSKEKLPAGVEKNKLTLLSVGRMSAPKNPIRLLNVHKKLLEDGFNQELWWVGDGELRTEVENFVNENGLNNSVKLWGYQKNPYPFMREADILACSSNYEGYSTFITEGVILGKPIVTTDCSGMKEILSDYLYGRITANTDAGFYEGLRDSINDIEKEKSGVLPEFDSYSLNSLVAQNESFFEELLH